MTNDNERNFDTSFVPQETQESWIIWKFETDLNPKYSKRVFREWLEIRYFAATRVELRIEGEVECGSVKLDIGKI